MTADTKIAQTVTLRDGVRIPRLGLGVWQAPGTVATNAVRHALALGYRHIDTAAIYGNEAEVGAAVRAAELPEGSVFVTTKLWTQDHGYDQALRAFDASLKRLGLPRVDLYLSHFPVAGKRNDAFRAMATLVKGGACRSIGVSNYTERHLTELMDKTGLVPSVNQVEFHPFLYQRDLLAFCRKHQIQIVAYSPLVHGKKMGDPRLVALAERHERTPAQILLRWALEHQLVVIPKSAREERIAENARIFDFTLAPAEVEAMNRWNEDLRTCWDPTDEP
jgi:diketogulonate reductase-like aldo/keto reductase